MQSSVKACLLALATTGFAIPSSQAPALFDRQFGSGAICCAGQCKTEALGNEKSWNLHMQVTENLDCGDGPDGSTCSISQLNSKTVTWSVDTGLNTPFASIGGGVSKSMSTGTVKNCGGEEGIFCVWASIPHKSYEAQKIERLQRDDTCDEQPNGPYTITAPTGDHDFYCVHGSACRGDGQSYWEEL